MRRIIIGLALMFGTFPAWAGDCTKHNAKVLTIQADGDLYDAQKARFDLITPKPAKGDVALCAAAWKVWNDAGNDLLDADACSDDQGNAVNGIYQGMSTILGALQCAPQ